MKDISESNILIVEDNDLDRSLLKNILVKNGFLNIHLSELVNIENEIIAHHIDIVLLDISLGELSGIDILNTIRQNKSAIELPVIMVTSLNSSHDVSAAFKLGANDYITKPIDFGVAISRISTQLTVKRLTKSMEKLKQMESLSAIVTTYNHEINNPLAICKGSLSLYKKNNDEKYLLKIENALERIHDIIKKISNIDTEAFSYEEYSEDAKMLDLNKTKKSVG